MDLYVDLDGSSIAPGPADTGMNALRSHSATYERTLDGIVP